MHFFDFIVTGCFGGAPALPPLPPAPEPLPAVDEGKQEREDRMKKLSSKKKGRSSLITNQGGAAGLQGEEDSSKKTKLGGN
tara:strand:+ start:422 stop:664 length:243 start_codon:yes stop_codon:yes gene_type:complete